MPVRTMPGETEFTRMPSRPNSCASTRISMITAALLGAELAQLLGDRVELGLRLRHVHGRDLCRLAGSTRVARQPQRCRPPDPARRARHQCSHAFLSIENGDPGRVPVCPPFWLAV